MVSPEEGEKNPASAYQLLRFKVVRCWRLFYPCSRKGDHAGIPALPCVLWRHRRRGKVPPHSRARMVEELKR